MKICILTQEYPSSQRPDAMAFTHVRNLLYKKLGHEVTVVSFGTQESYDWEGVSVFPETAVTPDMSSSFDIFVCHSPNVRNHLRFLLKANGNVKAKVMVSHGHEFIDWYTQKPRPFDFHMNFSNRVKVRFRKLYDAAKLRLWAWYFFSQKGTRLALVCVSDPLYRDVNRSLGVNVKDLVRAEVISNPIHPIFAEKSWNAKTDKVADFVTVRSFDDPKYAVDVVIEVARRNPQWTFHIFGQGTFFAHYPPPSNVTVILKKFKQADLPQLLDKYHAMLLPTRWDSQGVLMCEVAAYGMPLIVSDLPICHEMVGEFENVSFINNENPQLKAIPTRTLENNELKSKFGPDQTVMRELRLFDDLVNDSKSVAKVPDSPFMTAILSFLNGVFSVMLLRSSEPRTRD